MNKLSLEEETKLKENYQKELKLYESMFNIALKQEEMIQSRNLTQLLSLINQRKEIINKINQIEQKILPLKGKWTEAKDYSLGGEVSLLVKKLSSLLEKILTQEQKNSSLLKKSIRKVNTDLEHIQKGKALHKAYGNYFKAKPRFMDQVT
ncbi:flagellar export chaperone FlgN [Candidatus Aerophobetes bacterium]|nr:flagellar export chaperone FlgN [Candidatus Aerophobetes bacterium]